jgi:putative transposase
VKKSRFTESQILVILTEGRGNLVAEACRKCGIVAPTCYQWESKDAGMSLKELKRVKALEAANPKVRREYSVQAWENTAIKDVLPGKL